MENIKKIGLWGAIIGLSGAVACSTANLRKFDNDDIGKGISADIAKKFEVKEVVAPQALSQAPGAGSPEVSKAQAIESVKEKKKIKKTKKERAMEKAQSVEPPYRRPAVLPFLGNEKLEYDIRYLGVTAGYLTLESQPIKEVNSRKVFHFIGSAKTVKLFELVYRVDDSIESFWDYDGLFSHRFTMNLDESKQTRKLIELYDYEKKKSFYWNRVDHVEKGYSEVKQEFDIALWSQDVLSALYYVRTVELPKDTASSFRFPVILDGKPWESVFKFVKKAKIYANGKDQEANIYNIQNYQNGELKNKDNTIWISDDEHRYILRVEAKVKVGSFAVALEKAE